MSSAQKAPVFTSFPTFSSKHSGPDTTTPSQSLDSSRQADRSRSENRDSVATTDGHRRSGKRKGKEEEPKLRHRKSPSTRYERDETGASDAKASDGRPHRDKSRSSKVRMDDPTRGHHSIDPYPVPNSDRGRSELYFTDTVGDKGAQTYQATSSFTSSRYYRQENGRLLGLPGQFRTIKTAEKSIRGVEIAKSGQPYIPRYADRARQEEEHMRFRMVGTTFQHTAVYLPIVSEDEMAEGSNELDSLEPAKSTSQHAVDLARERTQTFEAHLAMHPGDTSSWIDYSRAHVFDSDDSHRVAQLDISLSILDRGLRGMSLTESVPLHLEYLRVAAEIWPSARVEHAWSSLFGRIDQAIRGLDNMGQAVFELWLGHLDWSQGQGFGHNGRDLDNVVDLYEQRLDMVPTYEKDQGLIEERRLYLFTRLSIFLARAGHHERAIAAFQALFEISLSLAEDSSHSISNFSGMLNDFAEYWDSGRPRLGEDGAKGWTARHADHSLSVGFADSHTPDSSNSDSDLYRNWYTSERGRDRQRRPDRLRDAYCEAGDPFRTIVFADIRSLMFPIRTSESLRHLASGFLYLLGVTVGPPGTPTTVLVNKDPHMVPIDADIDASVWPVAQPKRVHPWQIIAGEAMEPTRQSRMSAAQDSPVRCWSVNRDTLIANEWFNDLDVEALGRSDVDMIRNVVEVCQHRLPDPFWDLVAVAVESAASAKRALKSTKAMLARWPENVTLWAAHARLESKRGNRQAARAVYTTILAHHTRVAASIESQTLAMWADWALMEWRAGEQERCTEVLLCLADSRIPEGVFEPSHRPRQASPLSLLKGRQFYKIDKLPSDRSRLALSALFHYQDSCEDATRLLQQNAEACDAGSFEQEDTLQLLIEVLHRHSIWHPGPKAVIRQCLQGAMTAFPDNTIFLSTFLWHQLQSGLQRPIHDLTARLTEPNGTLKGIMWSIWAESVTANDLYGPGSGGASRVRALFKKALDSYAGRHCSSLWLRAIEFERLTGRPQAARTLFYRAMGHVGGCKELYMIPFKDDLRDAFTDAELTHIVEAMVNRGIRVRCDPEGFAMALEAGDNLPSDEELEDDELKFLRDRQANKPY